MYSKGKISQKPVNEFFEAIPSKFKLIEFALHEINVLAGKDFEIREKRYQVLSLGKAYEKLTENYSENTNRNIKKAVKAGLIIQKGIAPKEVVDLFRNTKGQELNEFKSKDYKTLTGLMEACVKRRQAESIAVYDKEHNLCAAAFFMKCNNRFTFVKSGVNEFGKTNGAMQLLFDFFIEEHAGLDDVLDFGGSSVETVARFYKSFGAQDCVYLHVKKDRLSKLVHWAKSLKG